MDVHDKKTRSYNMSRIKGRDTKPEVLVRKFLFSQGFRYRKNVKSLPGKPDIVLRKYSTCVFVNGCFWHMHDNCSYSILPKNNAEFWRNKLQENVARDKKNYSLLTRMGWNIITVWECELKGDKKVETLSKLKKLIQNGNSLKPYIDEKDNNTELWEE